MTRLSFCGILFQHGRSTAGKVTVAAGEFSVGIADGYPMDVNYSATEPTAAEPAGDEPSG